MVFGAVREWVARSPWFQNSSTTIIRGRVHPIGKAANNKSSSSVRSGFSFLACKFFPDLVRLSGATPHQQFQNLRMVQSPKGKVVSLILLSLFLTIGTGLLFAACQSSETSKPDLYSQTSPPHDFQLVIGEGGGFTGQWNGYIVDSTGTVSSWRGTAPEQNMKRTAKLARKQLDKLWQSITNARFFDFDSTGTGNMTVAMQVTANGTIHRTSWAKPSGGRVPLAPVQALYDSCHTMVSRAK